MYAGILNMPEWTHLCVKQGGTAGADDTDSCPSRTVVGMAVFFLW